MDTSKINNLLNKEKFYLGTFSRDTLPKKIISKPSGLIANTDTSNKPGEHWVAMIFNEDGSGEYFDSYGLPPFYSEFYSFMDENCPLGWGYNRIILQCLTCITCGYYCVIYIKLRSIGYSFCDYISLFKYDKNANDSIIKKLVKKLFPNQ
jgi:hypothetical protein